MVDSPPTGPVTDAIVEVLAVHEAALVDLAIRRVKGRTHVSVVVFQREGVSLDTLAGLHRLLRPRLEEILDDRDLHVEFASPGIDRVFKSFHEFIVFDGYEVIVFLNDGTKHEGRINSVEGSRVTIRTEDGTTRDFAAEEISKARLRE